VYAAYRWWVLTPPVQDSPLVSRLGQVLPPPRASHCKRPQNRWQNSYRKFKKSDFLRSKKIWIIKPSARKVNRILCAQHILNYQAKYKGIQLIIAVFNFVISLSQYLANLMHKICFTVSFISSLYMFRAHVLIIRRSKLHYTASGIITLKQVSGLKLLKYSSINMSK